MELKLYSASGTSSERNRFNRTFMELKHYKEFGKATTDAAF